MSRRRAAGPRLERDLVVAGAAASDLTKSELAAVRSRKSKTVSARKQLVMRRLAADAANPARSAALRPPAGAALADALPLRRRLFAHPERLNARRAGGEDQLVISDADPMVLNGRRLDPRDFTPRRLKKGARVTAGTILGRIGRTHTMRASSMRFEIRPAGRGAPRSDPKPILDGWKLLESTAIYRSKKKNPFFGADAEQASIGRILLMSKETLERHVVTRASRSTSVGARTSVAGRSIAACWRWSSSSPPRASSRP